MFNPQQIVKFKKRVTPFYYYNMELLEVTLDTIVKEAGKYGYKIHYALKANTDDKILTRIRKVGFGADCVSGNEVQKALEIGFPAEEIFFAGVGKTDKEIQLGLNRNIGCFNCESAQELEVIANMSRGRKRKTPVALRINPDIDSQTHSYITTGRTENKFGFPMQVLNEIIPALQSYSDIDLIGLHFHIGSQITNMDVFKKLCSRVNEIEKWFYEQGFRLPVINLGGGLGIDYNKPVANPIPRFAEFFKTIHDNLLQRPSQEVHFELGRSVVGQMGTLISKVLYIKRGVDKNFAILDSGMTELIRPALYHSYHMIQNLSGITEKVAGKFENYEVVGPICETSDFLGKEIVLPVTERGDIIAIRSAGAYGQSMASNYNLREKAGVAYSTDL